MMWLDYLIIIQITLMALIFLLLFFESFEGLDGGNGCQIMKNMSFMVCYD